MYHVIIMEINLWNKKEQFTIQQFEKIRIRQFSIQKINVSSRKKSQILEKKNILTKSIHYFCSSVASWTSWGEKSCWKCAQRRIAQTYNEWR